ncbi:MAG: AzlC family ABC transporter permease [Hamadaea sp.]|nr:AzlC family ABC transporter permease [Hamadaea sp.]
MRTADRTPLDRDLVRDALAIGAAAAMIGVSYGAISIAQGMPRWLPVVMSLLIFAGGSQFLAVGMLAAGNPVAAVLGGLLVNVRHLPFGLAVGHVIGGRTRTKLLGAHVLIDENTAFALAQKAPVGAGHERTAADRRRQAYWLVGLILYVTWNLGVVAGVLLGGAVGDPAAFGLDAAFPAGLLALILPAMRDRTTRIAAVTGAVLAVATTPLLPAGLPVLAALLGVAAGRVLTAGRPARAPEPVDRDREEALR